MLYLNCWHTSPKRISTLTSTPSSIKINQNQDLPKVGRRKNFCPSWNCNGFQSSWRTKFVSFVAETFNWNKIERASAVSEIARLKKSCHCLNSTRYQLCKSSSWNNLSPTRSHLEIDGYYFLCGTWMNGIIIRGLWGGFPQKPWLAQLGSSFVVGFVQKLTRWLASLAPLSGILMLARVAEHASPNTGMRAKTRRKRSTLGISLIFLIFSLGADLSWSRHATQAVGGAAATKWISLHG